MHDPGRAPSLRLSSARQIDASDGSLSDVRTSPVKVARYRDNSAGDRGSFANSNNCYRTNNSSDNDNSKGETK